MSGALDKVHVNNLARAIVWQGIIFVDTYYGIKYTLRVVAMLRPTVQLSRHRLFRNRIIINY